MTPHLFTRLSLAAALPGGLAIAELAAQELHLTGGAVEALRCEQTRWQPCTTIRIHQLGIRTISGYPVRI